MPGHRRLLSTRRHALRVLGLGLIAVALASAGRGLVTATDAATGTTPESSLVAAP
jgi:hypothetical protein